MPSSLFIRYVFLFELSYGPNLGLSWYSVGALSSIPGGLLCFCLSSSFYGFYDSILSGSFGRLGSDLLYCGCRRVSGGLLSRRLLFLIFTVYYIYMLLILLIFVFVSD